MTSKPPTQQMLKFNMDGVTVTSCMELLPPPPPLLVFSNKPPPLLCPQTLLLISACMCRDQLARLDLWEIEAIPDPQAHLVNRVFLEPQAKKEPR